MKQIYRGHEIDVRRGRKVYVNELCYLHDPARFGITVPSKE